MSTALRERLTSSMENLRTVASLEFTDEVFESDNYRSAEVLTEDLQSLFIVNIRERTLTILTMNEEMEVTKETLFTDKIISMKELFNEYSLNQNTPPWKLELVLLDGRTIEVEPGLSKLHDESYKDPEIAGEVAEDFENFIAGLKNTLIL
ncbi:hypothetical protein [Halobacillus halophilus]|uniref:hypothetical protein n=1 Tax=Halobacillus halophilus TaxID=1570 RepID=UPI001CD7E931|nr:hypothetical protein [Halobacillus halophilus]MCA1012216.1 hypothetical protein [Halobacillus halophilus]